MSDTIYYQRNRDVILNRATDYYEKIKKDWKSKQKINAETYLKKTKTKRENMEKNRYHNMSEEKKQKLKEYQKNYREAKKSQYNNE